MSNRESGSADHSAETPHWHSMEMVEENKLVCHDCGGTVQLHMTTRYSLFAQCACTWSRVEDITGDRPHIWWPDAYVEEGGNDDE